jgi:hypothetical protein
MRFLSAYLIIRTTASGFEKQKKGKNKMNRTSRTFRPMLSFFHANAKGNGAAMRMSLLPATGTEDGSIMVDFANQSAVADFSGPEPVYPRFDWENKITVKLDFGDLCALLQVLRGECESVGDGKGLFHKSVKGSTRIMFRHLLPNITGPVLISFTFGVAGAILAESGLSFLGFGVQPPTASWGGLLRQAFDNPLDYWHLTFFPGAALFLAVISFNFIGEGMRRSLDLK